MGRGGRIRRTGRRSAGSAGGCLLYTSRRVESRTFDADRNVFFFTFVIRKNIGGAGERPEGKPRQRPVSYSHLDVYKRQEVTRSLEDYDPTPAARAIQEFVGENLSNW